METVSIIVPMYNVEQYVEKCLKSLLNQSYKNIKIYAVSDGSPDNSLKIAKSIAVNDPRIECIEKENGGYGSVLQETIKRIDSKYFMICDPDDWIADNAVEMLLNAAESNDVDIVIADKYTVSIDDNNPVIVRSNSNYPFVNIIPNIIEEAEVEKYSFLFVSPHAKLYKTEIAKNIIFPNKVSYTDCVLYLISLANSKSVIYIDKPLAFYLLDRPGNTNTDRSLKSINSHIIVWNSIYDQLDSKNHDFIYNRLYFEYKMFLHAYYKNRLHNNDTYNDLKKIRKRLVSHKKNIKRINNDSFVRRMDYLLLLNRFLPLKGYILINRLFNNW